MAIDTGSLKAASLLLLAIQNFAYGFILPVSRKPDESGRVYFGPTAVLVTELLKIIMSIIGLAWEGQQLAKRPSLSSVNQKLANSIPIIEEKQVEIEEYSYTSASQHLPLLGHKEQANWELEKVPLSVSFAHIKKSLKNGNNLRVLFPAILFVIQNNLQMVAGQHLDATEFQVLSQLKLVSAALCSVLILKKTLKPHQWGSIALLFLGICLVQRSNLSPSATMASDVGQGISPTFIFGFVAMLCACCCSGVANVTMEYFLKNELGFWVSNLLLSACSIIPASIPLVVRTIQYGAFNPFLGFTSYAWSAILLNVVGGFLVAMTMKYADNVLKGFAVSVSLLATVVANSFIEEYPFSWLRLLGTLLVVESIVSYGQSRAIPFIFDRSLPKEVEQA